MASEDTFVSSAWEIYTIKTRLNAKLACLKDELPKLHLLRDQQPKKEIGKQNLHENPGQYWC